MWDLQEGDRRGRVIEAQKGLRKLQDVVGQLLEGGMEVPGRSRQSPEQLSVMVTRISIRGLTKWDGDLSRRHVPNHRGGVPFHVTGAQLGGKGASWHTGVAFVLITDKAGSSGITLTQERRGQLKR